MLKKGLVKTNSAGYATIEGDFGKHPLNMQDSRRVLDKDEVLFDTKPDGSIAYLKITKRASDVYVGRVEYKHGNWVLLADKSCFAPIYIKGISYLIPGVVVSVRIDGSHLGIPAYAKLERVIGQKEDASFIAEYALAKHDLESVFDYKPLQWLKKTVLPKPEESTTHVDLTTTHFITIDGPDTKDFDDAISIAKESHGGYRLKVAISDVSFYIKDGSDIDECAFQRGTSVYFADKVTPMLPPELSNGLLSLRPGEVRLAVVCDMHINSAGEVSKYNFYRAKIMSKRRMTYEEAYLYLTQPEVVEDKCAESYHHLRVLEELYLKVSSKTISVQELSDDNNILVKKNDLGYYVMEDERTLSHFLVECAMLLANECAAQQVVAAKKPFLRSQEGFTDDHYAEIENWLGFKVPRNFVELVQEISAHSNKRGATIVLKNQMESAEYTTEVKGHFSLNVPYYTHFTSPIRRYADLTVHRILLGEKISRTLSEIAKKCTEQSKKAKYAEKFYMDSIKKFLIASTFSPSTAFKATILTQSEKSIKLRLGVYGLMTFINNKSLEEAGLFYDSVKNKWSGIDIGYELPLEYAGYFEDNFGHQLKFKLQSVS